MKYYKEKVETDYQEIDRIIKFFQNNKVKVVKLNYCLSESGSTQSEAYMQLSEDGNFF